MTTPPPAFEILNTPHKGHSVFATRFIRANTALFHEAPLLAISSAHTRTKLALLARAFAQLPAPLQAVYLSLCNSPSTPTPTTAVVGIWNTNTFVLDAAGVLNAVFCTASRLNHACCGGANARWEWCADEGLVRFWADRDIEAGEEITHCYRPDWRMGTQRRREALLRTYGFWCTCGVCEGPEDD